jgi:hypothetical protein
MIPHQENAEIRIDREGIWYFRGEQMKRFEIVTYLYQYLKKDDQGRYRIEIGHDRCAVSVEDAPYIVRSLEISDLGNVGPPAISIALSDGSLEALGSDTRLWIGDGNVLYCEVKNGEHQARFARPAYYQLCQYVEYDAVGEHYSIRLRDCLNPLVIRSLNQNGGPHVR